MPPKSLRHNVTLSPIVDDCVRSEAIVRNVSIQHIIAEAMTERYINGTLIHKKLNWIMMNMKNSDKIPKNWLNDMTLFDIPNVSFEEIDASAFSKKRKYIKKSFEKNPSIAPDKPKDVFSLIKEAQK